MTQKTIIEDQKVKEILKMISARDFVSFGYQQFAYIKPVSDSEGIRYEVRRADGEEITTVDSESLAIVMARQNDLAPMIIH